MTVVRRPKNTPPDVLEVDSNADVAELDKGQFAKSIIYPSNKSEELPKSFDIPKKAFFTNKGTIYHGDSRILMQKVLEPNSVDLIMTSPPFGLIRKKEYGNEDAEQYVEWFEGFAEGFVRILKPTGSLVIDIAGGWQKGQPTRSLYHYELLIMLARKYKFHLAQEFFWWNPAKLPNPIEWVNIRKVRVKDAVNFVWWLSLSPYPKASNRRVLQPYSKSMETLMERGYKPKLRPSGHDISDKFQKDNGGSIPPNLIALANTESNSTYQRYCKDNNFTEHPARFPTGLPSYFIRMLTDPGDLIFDPFAGSCVTGEAAEKMNRRWVCCEIEEDYIGGASGRFSQHEEVKDANDMIYDFAPKNEADEKKRGVAYEIFPPHLSLMREEETSLIQDGGYQRPNKKRK